MPQNLIFHNADQEIVPYNGEPLTWRVSVYALVVKNGALLITKHKQEKLFDIPGGGIELGETIEEALAREGIEEAGASLKIGELIHLNHGFFYHSKGAYYQAIQLFYSAELEGELGQATDPQSQSAQFVPFGQLSKYPVPSFVEKAIQKLNLV